MNGNDIVAYANSTRCCKISMNASSGFSECAGWAMWGGDFESTRFEGAHIFSLRAFKDL